MANTYNVDPALTDQARESKLISLAQDLAEKKLRDGTASSQLITHFLSLATAKEQAKIANLTQQNDLMAAKTETLNSAPDIVKLCEDAMAAMRSYQPKND